MKKEYFNGFFLEIFVDQSSQSFRTFCLYKLDSVVRRPLRAMGVTLFLINAAVRMT